MSGPDTAPDAPGGFDALLPGTFIALGAMLATVAATGAVALGNAVGGAALVGGVYWMVYLRR